MRPIRVTSSLVVVSPTINAVPAKADVHFSLDDLFTTSIGRPVFQ